MDSVEKLRLEGENEYVAYTEFILEFDKRKNDIYIFLEGFEDQAYYPIRVRSNVDDTVKDFVCHGKENVINIHNLIKKSEEYKDVKTLYFVDSDFDNNKNIPDTIYITPTYSIENLYVSQVCLERILTSEFKFKKKSDDLIKCMRMYQFLFSKFIDVVDNLNIWLACQNQIRDNDNVNTQLKIDKTLKGVFPKNLITENLNDILDIDDFVSKDSIEIIFKEACSISIFHFEKLKTSFILCDKRLVFRGKFYLKLLESFLLRLQSLDYKKHTEIFTKKYNSNLDFKYTTLCSVLSQYADTPSCLKTYIKANC